MTTDPDKLKQKLDETTERLKRADNSADRYALGGDVRELEKQVEIAEGPDPDPPRHPRP